MSTGPRNPNNPHKNKKITIKDASNNVNTLLPKEIIFLNPLFIPLQHWKDQKSSLPIKDDPEKSETNNINTKRDPFTMKIDNVLNKIRQDREINAKQLKEGRFQNFIKLRDGMDKTGSDNPDDILLLKDKPSEETTKKDIKQLIKEITAKYDLIQPRGIFEKPAPPPKRRTRRRNSLYIPPNSKILHPKITPWGTTPLPPPPMPSLPLFKKTIEPPLPPTPMKDVNIDIEVNSLADLLSLIERYPLEPDIRYNIDMKSIHDIGGPISELNQMIGMNKLKSSVVDQVVYFAQNLHINKEAKNQDFMHTVIYGPPGTGKTEVAKIMGKIFCSLGVLKRNTFKKVTRSDLIAGYLGQTALKTRDVIRDCLGGVLFIDEAYALGNPEKRDSFAKECIDTLCESLSDNKERLMVIIAGYQEDLKKCFFAYNQGLDSRFPWRFKTDDYNARELNLIFQKKVKDAGWSIQEKIPDGWFESKMPYFKFFGRDMETLLAKTKIAHARRVFCKPKKVKTKLTLRDLERGFEMFIDNDEVQDRKGKALNDVTKLMYM